MLEISWRGSIIYCCWFHNIMNGDFFFAAFSFTLLSLKWQMIGFFISILSKSESVKRENLAPSSPFLCTWFTILSSIPMCRKNVDMSSAENACRLPSLGISISCSGINFCFAKEIKIIQILNAHNGCYTTFHWPKADHVWYLRCNTILNWLLYNRTYKYSGVCCCTF